MLKKTAEVIGVAKGTGYPYLKNGTKGYGELIPKKENMKLKNILKRKDSWIKRSTEIDWRKIWNKYSLYHTRRILRSFIWDTVAYRKITGKG